MPSTPLQIQVDQTEILGNLQLNHFSVLSGAPSRAELGDLIRLYDGDMFDIDYAPDLMVGAWAIEVGASQVAIGDVLPR